jgi:arylsulfatase A-like enzyme
MRVIGWRAALKSRGEWAHRVDTATRRNPASEPRVSEAECIARDLHDELGAFLHAFPASVEYSEKEMSDKNDGTGVTRRDFLRQSSLAAATPLLASEMRSGAQGQRQHSNVILIISDQFRWDCLGANGRNPLNLTPNLDTIAREGTNFANSITNQPVCAPSRACLFTGQYATKNTVWQNGIPLPADIPTVAKAFRTAGYTANYAGKWHLSLEKHDDTSTLGWVPPQFRGGFDDWWEGSNVMEWTSHPYEGSIWNGAGEEIKFQNRYRVDFLTDRVIRFLETVREPFFLVISYLEPHFQNDCNCFVAPKGYSERYQNSFVPRDLRFFPGDWQSQLPDYYGCIASVDENVARLREALQKRALTDRTIFGLISDHGCHFRTRNPEYKRSAHESSIHVPLVITGPGFHRGRTINDLIGHIDVAPTLLDAVGIKPPSTMQGRSMMPLVENGDDAAHNQEVYIQISESMTARALRTPQWTYVVAAPDGKSRESSPQYVEYQLYDLYSDPDQIVNLAGRKETKQISANLCERLRARMAEAGERPAEIVPAPLYP